MDNSSFETVSLGDYFGVVWRRKWIVALVTVMFAAAGFLYSMHQQKKYSSTSSVTLNPSSAAANQGSKASALSTWGGQQVGIADSAAFATEVWGHIHTNPLVQGMSPQDLLNATVVSATPGGNGVQFVATATDPSAAKLIASGFAGRYPYYLRFYDSNSAINQAKQNLSSVQAKLADVDTFATTLANTPARVAQVAGWKLNENRYNATLQYEQSRTLPEVAVETQTIPRLGNQPTQTAPKTTQNVLLGAIIGFILGIILAFIQDSLDTRVRNADEIGRRLRLPLLAQVPPASAAGGR